MSIQLVLDIPKDIGKFNVFSPNWIDWVNTMRERNGESFDAIKDEMFVSEWDGLSNGWYLRDVDHGRAFPWVPEEWMRPLGWKPTTCRCDIIQLWNVGHGEDCPERLT